MALDGLMALRGAAREDASALGEGNAPGGGLYEGSAPDSDGGSAPDARDGRSALDARDGRSAPDARSRARARAHEVLPVAFYARPVLEVARELIGCVVEHGGLAGRIVETEAYHESEPACHAFVGVTPRTRTLFGEPGLAYVYRSYGIHALLNAVCEPRGIGAAVLIRALEPLVGIEEMRMRRARAREQELCSGPGKLTQALGVGLAHNGTSLLDGPIVIRAGEVWDRHPRSEEPGGARNGACLDEARLDEARLNEARLDEKRLDGQQSVTVGTRIGITKAVDLRWRFCEAGNPHVSRPWPQL